MLKWLFIIGSIIGLNESLIAQLQLGPIGSWRAHFSNESIQQIVKGDQLYLGGLNQIIQIDKKNQINYLNTTNGLHHIGISKLAWHPIENQLVVAYKNNSIDIIKGDQVTLINDITLTDLYSDKTINDLSIINDNAYIACNFGIVVIDLLKKEIKETLFPSDARQAVKVFKTLLFQNKLFALTEDGIWSASLSQRTLWNKENTTTIKVASNLFEFKNQLYFNNEKSIYAYQDTVASFQISSGKIQTISTDADHIYAGVVYQNKGAVIQLNSNNKHSIIIDSNELVYPNSILKEGNDIWVADFKKGLYLKNSQPNWIALGGPYLKTKGSVAVAESQLLISYGASKMGISNYSEMGWKNFTKLINLDLNYVEGLSIDPSDKSWWMGLENYLVHYDPKKETVEKFLPHPGLGSIKSIQQDLNGNIAILKEGFGLVIKEGTQWNAYPIPPNFSSTNLKAFIASTNKLNWIIGPRGQGVLLFQKKNNQPIWKQLNVSKSNGNLPSMEVTAILEDKEGSVWVGTDNGLVVFQCNDINEACDGYLPIVESNGFNGYLFQKETINCISIDGADRKWIGTNKGAWLISKDGTEVLEHFTVENSPLPNNQVLSICIEPTEGDVFFFTENEIMSYKGNATEGAAKQNKIKIFPNPVTPNYNGPILFRNLTDNALVKITDLNGQLIAQMKALGGQATWNGRDQNQYKVASGIYLIFVRDELGIEKAVGKIMITTGN